MRSRVPPRVIEPFVKNVAAAFVVPADPEQHQMLLPIKSITNTPLIVLAPDQFPVLIPIPKPLVKRTLIADAFAITLLEQA
jgi:hypothetical protein